MPVEPRTAAAVIVATADGQILVGERAPTVRFMNGYVTVPGGKVDDVDRRDASILWPNAADGAERAAAVRELREECGVLLTDEGLIAAPATDSDSTVDALRQAGVQLSEGALAPAGRWITPDYSPVRFDTHFFLAITPRTVAPRASPELAWADFRTADALWQAYLDLEIMLPPPFRAQLEILQRAGTDGAARRLRTAPGARGEFHPDFEPISGIRQLPLRTPTLPPATHTNAYIVGHERLIVVDPAPYDADQRAILQSFLQSLIGDGATFDSVVLTHHHPDHMGAAQWIADRFDVPIRAHPLTRDLLRGQVEVTALLEEGHRVDLGADRAGRPFELDVLFTPGHAPGHIVLVDRRPSSGSMTPSMIVGDMVASIGSIIIDPSEGDMAEYIHQLRRLRERPQSVLLPAHGAPVVDGHGKLDHYVKHRLHREEKVFAALSNRGLSEPVDLLPEAYDDTPPQLHPLAARACLAHLEKLVTDGRAQRDGVRFVAIAPKSGALG